MAFLGATVKRWWALVIGFLFGLWALYEFVKPQLPVDLQLEVSLPIPLLVIACGASLFVASFLAFHDVRTKPPGISAGAAGNLTVINNFYGPARGSEPPPSVEESSPEVTMSGPPLPVPDSSSRADWMQQDTYSDRSFRLVDVPMDGNRISGKTFERCTIYGPAVIAPLGKTAIVGCTWEGELDGILWEVAPGRRTVVGVVGLEDCSLTDCRFSGVGFAGPPNAIAQFREGTARS